MPPTPTRRVHALLGAFYDGTVPVSIHEVLFFEPKTLDQVL